MGRLVLAGLIALGIVGGANAGEREEHCHVQGWAAPKAFDAKNGQDPTNYPPDRLVDVGHVKLDLTFADLASKSFAGVETYTFAPIASGVRRLTLNGVDLRVAAVKDGEGNPLRFDYDDKQLVIHFPDVLAAEADVTVRIEYRCEDPVAGLTFVLPDSVTPDRSPQVHSQGEAEYNRYWFFCHDFPNERSATEMVVTVPKPFQVISNGELLGQTERGDAITWHWRQDIPHAAYLVTLVIGRFAEVRDEWRGIPVLYYVKPGQEQDARRSFARTVDMLEFFSQKLGTPYPFKKYAQVCVERFGGGMENTSATTLHDDVPMDARAALDHDQDGLIAHEMAHQWFGDLLTCKSWAHLWLNEGFASFCDAIWDEHRLGRDEFLCDKWRSFRSVAASDSSETPGGVVYADYTNPEETFRHKGSLPYGKGSALLHMLRHELGDEVFWTGIAEYVKAFREREVETEDFRKVLERVSGRSLVQFFDQWAYRPGVPRLRVEFDWDDENSMAEVTITQTQKIDRQTPAFAVPLDLYFRCDGHETRRTVQLAAAKEVFRQALPKRPDLFCADPEIGLLKELNVEQPRPMWLTQLTDGPTAATRCEAARRLGEHDRPEVAGALAQCAKNEKEFWAVRAEAVRSLGRMQTPRALTALLSVFEDSAGIDHPKVRRAAAESLAYYRDARAIAVLKRLAVSDASYAVEAEATASLGRVEALDALDVVLANVRKPSYRNEIRRAALDALERLRDPAGVAVCLEAAAGRPDRTRTTAIAALGALGKIPAEQERVRNFLVPLLADADERIVRAAIDALGELEDERALEPLRPLRDSARRKEVRDRAAAAVERIIKHQQESSAVRSLLEELESLKAGKDALLERVKALESQATDDKKNADDAP